MSVLSVVAVRPGTALKFDVDTRVPRGFLRLADLPGLPIFWATNERLFCIPASLSDERIDDVLRASSSTCLDSAEVRRSGTRQRLQPWQGRSCRATRVRLKWSNGTKLSELAAVLFSVEGAVTSYNSPHSACQGWQMSMQKHRLRARHSFGYRTAAHSRLRCVSIRQVRRAS